MTFVASDPFLVDHTLVEILALIDLRVTPGGGYQVVWDAKNGTSGTVLHHTTYRIFDSAGAPLTDEIVDASYQGRDPPVQLRRSIELDDGTTLRVDTIFNTSSPGSRLVLQRYDESGAPLGAPVFTAFIDNGLGGLAQLPNRDIVFVAQSVSKTGAYNIISWVLDNTSPDLYAPELTRIGGADGAAQVAVDGTIVVGFNELIALSPSARIDLKTASGQLVDSFDVSDGADLSAWVSTLTIRPSATLDPGTAYVLEFAPGSLLDPSGNAFAGGGFDFTTAGDPVPPPPPGGDGTAPTAIDFFPAAGSHMLPPDWSPAITFSETVQGGSGTITLQTATGELVQTFGAGDPGIQFLGASVIIDPAADLQPGTTYRLTVSAGAIQDLAGNAYAGVSDYVFTTAGEAPSTGDTAPPVAIDFFPASGSNTLPPDWSPGITFSEAVQAGSGTITLQTAAGDVVQTFGATDAGIRIVDTRVLIDPAADLLPGTTYRLIVGPAAFEDLAGNAYGGVSDYSFTTAGSAPPPPPAGPILVYSYPDSGKIMFTHSLGLVFNEPVKLGSGVITLETTAGEVIQAFPSFGPGFSSGTRLFIDPTADLQIGTSYRLVIGPSAVVDLDGNPYPGTTSLPFTAVTTSAIHVVSMDPAPRSNTLPPDANLSITFDGPVKAGSGGLTLMSTLGDFQETFVTATDPGVQFIGSTLVIDPAVDLQPGTQYHVGFGRDAVEDLAGNFVGVPDFFFSTALVGVPTA